MNADDPQFAAWLYRETGIDAPSLGPNALERAIEARAQIHAHATIAPDAALIDAYWQRLTQSAEERQALIDALVVPETWFLREPEAFVALAKLASARLKRAPLRPLRILSVPCSSGEEPYSIALTLLDAGLEPAQFSIDAFDISVTAIAAARRAVYGRNAFRGVPPTLRERHFRALGEGWQLNENVRACVNFAQRNLFALANEPVEPWDFVFCRNVLIYFDRESQDRAVALLSRWLAAHGTLFVGPAETGLMMRHDLSSARIALAFAFRHGAPSHATPERTSTVQTTRTPTPLAAIAPRWQAPFPLHTSITPASVPAVPHAQHAPKPVFDDDTRIDARRLADAGQLDEAERLAHEHVSAHGPHADSFYLLGLIADARGREVEANALYRKALYLQPDHYEALTHLATLLDIAGEHDGARQLMRRAERASRGLQHAAPR